MNPPEEKPKTRFRIFFRCPHCKELISAADLKQDIRIEMG